MTKIVYNGCYGGFSLSPAALKRYAEIKGWEFHESNSGSSWSSGYVLDPQGNEYSQYGLTNRTDPILVQVVEELGEEANGFCAELCIDDIPVGTKYRIDEYDGSESVMTIDCYNWSVA